MTEAKSKPRIAVSWVALYAAILGVTSLVPVLPYVGGGGFVPLAVPLAALAPLILGLPGGIIAAFVGGLIGMFISPAAYPLLLVDVMITGTTPAIFVGLAVNLKKWWPIAVLNQIAQAIIIQVFPYVWPGPAGGFDVMPQPKAFLSWTIYWVPWVILYIIPKTRNWIYDSVRSPKAKQRFYGLLVAALAGLYAWKPPYGYPYYYVFHYPAALTYAAEIYFYSWWVPILAVITTIVGVPLIEALRQSGLRKIAGAIW